MAPERPVIRASHIGAYDGGSHRFLRDGVVVYEANTIVQVGKTFDDTSDRTIDAAGDARRPAFCPATNATGRTTRRLIIGLPGDRRGPMERSPRRYVRVVNASRIY